MPKCIDCAWFPWKPGADFSLLPVQRCHPKLKARRWPGNAATVTHECPHYQEKEKVIAVGNPKDELTIAELRDYIETTTDPAEIERLLVEEQQREEPRKTAVKLLQDRLKELQQGKAPNTGGEGHDTNAGIENGA